MCDPSVTPDSQSKQPKPAGLLQNFSDLVDSTLSGAFGSLGESLGNRPYFFMILSVLIAMGACSGFSMFATENRSDKLWIPQGTQAQTDGNKFQSTFDKPFRISYFITEPKSGNMLSKANLEKLMALHDAVEAVEVEDLVGGTDEMEDLNSLCFAMPGDGHPCFISSVLQYWDYDAAALAAKTEEEIQATLADADVADLESFLSGFEVDDNGDYTANAAKVTYFLDNREVCESGNCVDEEADAWEGLFLETIEECDPAFTCQRFSERSFSDEFGAAIKGDVVFMNIGFLIIIVYLAVNLSGRWCDMLSSKVALSMMSVLAIGLAIGASMGMSSMFGWKYTPVHTVLPFVLLGLGVDDSFVIMNSFEQTPEEDPLPKRMKHAMSHAGVSITVTSVTDFVAFAISTATGLPALASFCFYAAMGILFLFLFQCTFFAAYVVIDARRTMNKKLDCCCCFSVSNPDTRDARRKEYNAKPDTMTAFMKNTYGPWIMNKTVAPVIAVLATALLGIGVWGAFQLKVDSNQLNFVPDSSYIQDTFRVNDELFGGNGVGVNLVFESTTDYFVHRKAVFDTKAALDGKAHLESFESAGAFESWFHGFVDYNEAECYGKCAGTNTMDSDGLPSDETQFYTNLNTYLTAGPGAQYQSSVVFEEGSTTAIVASKFDMKYQALVDREASLAIEAMTDLRAEVAKLGVDAYCYTFEFSTWETFIIIGDEMIMNVSLCMVAVFVITLVLIAHPVTALLVFFCVGCAIMEILGAMYFWGLIIDNVSVINLTLAVGLAVDYSAHVGHCFMVKHASNKSERVIMALEDIGGAVLNGAISTFLAVVVLSASESYVFRVLFKQFFLTCLFGVFNGMVFLPVLLNWFGPEPYASAAAGHGAGAKVVVDDKMEV